ncbi:MAG: right-handed parallel beta-helix repeat-containing protein [Kiritimatiellae bacterium]|nr:right-handed parallel beta-helix repeat-containing protein [Kiritimatiellia bacterium]MDD5519327.1 right-handed parallel beta-helix repeat-containing protein [Kiritimatiellia bacterium]
MKRVLYTVAALFYALMSDYARSDQIFVSLSGNNTLPYADLTTAATSIQPAIDIAANGSQILVSPGTYTGTGNVGIDFQGKKITLEGTNGYASTIIDCQSNGPAFLFHSGETTNAILSGFTIQNCGWLIDGGSSYSVTNPASGIVCISNSSPRITNFRIIDNRAFTGGGIYIESSSPQIENCIIDANYARYGGGIYCANGSIVVSNCTISGGLSDYMINSPPVVVREIEGGGIYCVSNSTLNISGSTISGNLGGGVFCSNSTATIRNTTISGNIPGGETVTINTPPITIDNHSGIGGGLLFINSAAMVENCTITENEGSFGGGISCQSNSAVLLSGCSISTNRGFFAKTETLMSAPPITTLDTILSGDGGGAAADSSILVISNCVFQENNSGNGGGVAYINHATGVIVNCTFSNNLGAVTNDSTTFNYDSGSINIFNTTSNAVGFGGGVYCLNSCPSISNCVIAANRSGSGGGIAIVDSPLINIISCTLSNNSAMDTNVGGGAVFLNNAGSCISNCTIMNNRAGEYRYNSTYVYANGAFLDSKDSIGYGGAFFFASNSLSGVIDCKIINNYSALGGSGFYCEGGSTANLERCMIRGGYNVVTQYSGYGGGALVRDSSVDLKVCVIADNNASDGGGIYASNTILTFLNTTIGYNRISTSGGGLYMDGGSAIFTNSIAWNNGSPAIFITNSPYLFATNSFIQGGINGQPESADPKLRFGYRITTDSPCIDNSIGPFVTQLDINGNTPWDHPSITNLSPAIIRDVGAGEFIDTDNDRMDDSWEIETFSNLSQGTNTDYDTEGLKDSDEYDFNTSPLLIDTDGDSMTDLQEWIAGCLGWDRSDFFMLEAVSNDATAGDFVIYWQSTTGRLYSVTSKSNLLDTLWSTNITGIVGDGDIKSYTNSNTAPSYFFRINVTRP